MKKVFFASICAVFFNNYIYASNPGFTDLEEKIVKFSILDWHQNQHDPDRQRNPIPQNGSNIADAVRWATNYLQYFYPLSPLLPAQVSSNSAPLGSHNPASNGKSSSNKQSLSPSMTWADPKGKLHIKTGTVDPNTTYTGPLLLTQIDIQNAVNSVGEGSGSVIPYFGTYLKPFDNVAYCAYLSNYHISDASYPYTVALMINGAVYSFNSVENAYQLGKCVISGLFDNMFSSQQQFDNVIHQFINATPDDARSLANTTYNFQYNPAKSYEIDLIMQNLVFQKFYNNNLPIVAETGKTDLVEGNTWRDEQWGMIFDGQNFSKGRNKLGKLLMYVRERISEKPAGNQEFVPLYGTDDVPLLNANGSCSSSSSSSSSNANPVMMNYNVNYIPSSSFGFNTCLKECIAGLFINMTQPEIYPNSLQNNIMFVFNTAQEAYSLNQWLYMQGMPKMKKGSAANSLLLPKSNIANFFIQILGKTQGFADKYINKHF